MTTEGNEVRARRGRLGIDMKPLAELAGVNRDARGRAIKTRRFRHGIKSVRQLAIQSGVSREAATAAEEGQASELTYERLEAWLDTLEEEAGADVKPAKGPRMVTISGARGDVDVVVSGPISDLDALADVVERLLRSAN